MPVLRRHRAPQEDVPYWSGGLRASLHATLTGRLQGYMQCSQYVVARQIFLIRNAKSKLQLFLQFFLQVNRNGLFSSRC